MIGGEIRRFIPVWKIIFPEIDARKKYDFSGGDTSSYFPYNHATNCMLYRTTGEDLSNFNSCLNPVNQ